MPILQDNYRPPGIFKNPDANTIYAATLRKISLPPFKRERINLSDDDFLDLDWSHSLEANSDSLVIILHGLAGNSSRPYMKGMAKIFNKNNWDVVCVNFRGCSEEVNLKYRSYHAGATDDLEEVLNHALSLSKYPKIALIGFSLGGNVVLKYLGEQKNIPTEIKAGVGISVPCDLAGSLGAINRGRNFIYANRFKRNLKAQLKLRAEKFPDQLHKSQVESCKSLRDIDDLYTSRAHGFKNADDYYKKNSSLQFLKQIKIPTLLLSAADDSFLSEKCYPVEIARNLEFLHFEKTKYGGHVGFVQNTGVYYHENRALEFVLSQ